MLEPHVLYDLYVHVSYDPVADEMKVIAEMDCDNASIDQEYTLAPAIDTCTINTTMSLIQTRLMSDLRSIDRSRK